MCKCKINSLNHKHVYYKYEIYTMKIKLNTNPRKLKIQFMTRSLEQ